MSEYFVIEEKVLCRLEERVGELVRDGFIPIGGIAVCSEFPIRIFYQAMYRKDPEGPPPSQD